MKKSWKWVAATTIALSLIGAPMAFAEDNAPKTENEQQQTFLTLKGTIEGLTKSEDGLYSLRVEQGKTIYDISIAAETLVYNNMGQPVTLENGQTFTAYVDNYKPMLAIYPPRYTPEVLIVETDDAGRVDYDTFNHEFVNPKNTLKLNLSDETKIINLKGEVLTQQQFVNKDVLVFYKFTTFSIPAQTTPSKIIVMEPNGRQQIAVLDVVSEIMAQDFYDINGIKMVPLRLVAEQLGYKVTSTGHGAILSKGTQSYTITVKQKAYVLNGKQQTLDASPVLLEKNKTYIPQSFVYTMMQQ